jgi:hypothetical protein
MCCLLDEQDVLIGFVHNALLEHLRGFRLRQWPLLHGKIDALRDILVCIEQARFLERIVIGAVSLVLHLLHKLVPTDQFLHHFELGGVAHVLRRIIY